MTTIYNDPLIREVYFSEQIRPIKDKQRPIGIKVLEKFSPEVFHEQGQGIKPIEHYVSESIKCQNPENEVFYRTLVFNLNNEFTLEVKKYTPYSLAIVANNEKAARLLYQHGALAINNLKPPEKYHDIFPPDDYVKFTFKYAAPREPSHLYIQEQDPKRFQYSLENRYRRENKLLTVIKN